MYFQYQNYNKCIKYNVLHGRADRCHIRYFDSFAIAGCGIGEAYRRP